MNKRSLSHFWIGRIIQFSIYQMLLIAAASVGLHATDVDGLTVLEKKIWLEAEDLRLKKVLTLLEEQAGVRFIYSPSTIDTRLKVSVNAKSESLGSVLQGLFQPISVDFFVSDDKMISLKRRMQVTQSVFSPQISDAPADVLVKGKVVDEKGEPLPGVSVLIKGTQQGAVTDTEGRFSINVPNERSVLVFSFVGYVSAEAEVGSRTSLEISLKVDEKALEEVVVVGYGTQKKVNLTGAVTMVDAEQISKRQVMNVGQALQGVVPGLNLVSNSNGGELNNTLNIDIRGMGTIGSGSSAGPLILIDGVEGNMNAINPKDIESIAVLKDAAASSIYGSRAAFGVILISTKKGKAGRMDVNYSNNVRFDALMNAPRTMGGVRYVDYINRAAANEGSTPAFSDLIVERIKAYAEGNYQNSKDSYWPEGTANYGRWRDLIGDTDWYNVFFKNWTPSQEHNLSASGGNDRVTFRLSAGLLDQNGKIRYGKDNYKRYTVAARIGATLSSWAKLNYNTSWIRDDYDRPSYVSSSNSGWFFHNAARLSPLSPVKDPNGHFLSGGTFNGIIQLLEGGRASDKRDFLTQQVQLVLEPVKNWRITGEGNLRIINNDNHMAILPVYEYDAFENKIPFIWDYWNALGISKIREVAARSNYYSTNLYTDYTKNRDGGHNFKLLLGFNSEYQKYKAMTVSRDGLLSPSIPTIGTTTTNPQIAGDLSDWANAGFFGRLNYDYKGRYLFEVNGRYDGSSRFVGNRRWGFFPSFSAGWNIAHEEFFSPLSDRISMLKIRGSWGALGNMNTNNLYPFYPTMPIGINNGGWLINGQQPNVASPPSIVSDMLTWEKVESANIGFDWSAFRNRFSGSFDYFRRYTKGMVGPAPQLPSTLGTGVPSINNTDMKSYGFEVDLSWRDKIGDISYGTKVLLANDLQRITNYPNEIMNFDTWYSGKMNGEIWGFTTKGIAQSTEQMENHLASLPNGGQGYFGSNWDAGDIMYEDLNGDGKVDRGAATVHDPGDMRIIGNSSPQYKAGWNVDVSWRSFDFSMFWAGVLKRDYVIGNAEGNSLFWGANANQAETFALIEHLDFWRPEGDPWGANPDGYYPRPLFASGYKNKHPQTRYLLNAAYMRLKNIQVGYTLSNILSQKLGSNSLRIYVAAENLITITPLTKLFDPEVLGGRWGPGKTYPLGKTLAAGLSVNF